MASWVFCNRCFQPPCSTSSFSLTNCGHVYCDDCLGKGKKDECLICRVPCRTVLLSKHTDSDIQAYFMGIDGLCKKYSKETFQVSEFQEKHRKRLLTFYREKISRLEEALRRSVLQVEQLRSMRPLQQTAFNTIKTSVSAPSAKSNGHVFPPPKLPASGRVQMMDVDLTPSPVRKPETAAGPTRISLISPPQDGRMGDISVDDYEHNFQRIAGKGCRRIPTQTAPPRRGLEAHPSKRQHCCVEDVPLFLICLVFLS
ncbi:probable E3 SUMO-protein ligase RNF212 isoform X2 [Choloepus didactylus]|uniref:probable E3 SUMO-protein ligase RNF212 isoform X2 n=1 Tax=Choloepus didactylus TaxID=27675 RepID=UPI00189FC2A1|nr:probable E3 SUMO-protein ligase RNF212 isoform X2 [Choloepus didactylus]